MKKTNSPLFTKLENFSKLPPSQLPPRSSKKVLEKSKFYSKNISGKNQKIVETDKSLYTQVSSKNISNILKIKENFPELSNKKIEEINKTIFGKADKLRPRINMTTKGLSRKQIIVPMSTDNTNKFILVSSEHITNLNHSLRNTKCQDRRRWTLFIFIFSLYFSFLFLLFSISIFRTTQVRGYQSRCHISHKLMV